MFTVQLKLGFDFDTDISKTMRLFSDPIANVNDYGYVGSFDNFENMQWKTLLQ